jgi:hypothetical protein
MRLRRPIWWLVLRKGFLPFVLIALLMAETAHGQGLTGTLIGTIKDEHGAVIAGARVMISSPALIAGSQTVTTSARGQLRFASLPPGLYVMEIQMPGFMPYREGGIYIGAGATLERTAVLSVNGVADSIVVEGAGSSMEARDAGLATRFRFDDVSAIPTRRASMFDFIRATPGVSPTSPSNATNTTFSAFGSGTNENQFLIDGTNFTCPCNGIARAEPGIDFIQEVQVQSAGASAEYGQMQGAVINVVLRQGGERFLSDTSYYTQPAGLTSQPVVRSVTGSPLVQSGYERARYRDVSTNLGGPVRPGRLWFFAGYQHLRDDDSQPGADPRYPRQYAQDKVYGKLTWQLAPGWELMQSLHNEVWANPDQPTAVTPFEVTLRRSTVVPAITFGQLTYSRSANTVWDIRLGRFVFAQDIAPSTGDRTQTNISDSVTNVSRGGPPNFTDLRIARTTAKATVTHFTSALLGADHEWKAGTQIERGGHDATNIIPTGKRYIERNGQPSQVISSDPSHVGALAITGAAFASDAVTLGNRVTVNVGVRFDHTRAVSQDLRAVDLQGRDVDQVINGLGTLYTWNTWSPRLGTTAKLTDDGRTILRASYGRFSQGVLTGELEVFHPGQSPISTRGFDPITGDYTRVINELSNTVNLLLDRDMRPPRSDEYSAGIDREIGRSFSMALAYIHKQGTDFIGWTETAGRYEERTLTLQNGDSVRVLALTTGGASRRFLLTNPEGYSVTYNGVVLAVHKRRSQRWDARGSYTFSKAYGLLASSGTTAAGAQLSTVSPPQPLTFGRDPNDLINARGRLPNDRPHVVRGLGSIDIPWVDVSLAANFQHFSGKPWAATALVDLPQNNQQRVLLEPRGSRRLSSQSLLDLRVSKTVRMGSLGRMEFLVDVLNALNDTAEEGIASDNVLSPNFPQDTVFVDPRRTMIGARIHLGR